MRLRHLLLALFTLTLCTYLSSWWNQFLWDDEQFIYANQYVLNFNLPKIFSESTTAGAGTTSDYYRPLTTLSFAVDVALWGLHPLPMHVANTLLHASNAVLLCLLLLRFGCSRKLAWAVAAIFAVHPLQTEAITYINSRGDALYTFFGLLSALSFSQLLLKRNLIWQLYNLRVSVGTTFFGVLTLLGYTLSIFSKEIGIATLGLLGLLYLQKLLLSRQTVMEFSKRYLVASLAVVLSGAIAASYLLLRATLLNFSNSFNLYNDGSLYSESLLVRLLTFSKVLWSYIKLLIVPYPLYMDRQVELVTSFATPWPWITLLLIGSLLMLGLAEYRQHKSVQIWLGTSWFLGMLLPVSGIVPINGVMYEHWLYLPLVGFCILVHRLLSLYLPSVLKKIFILHKQAILYLALFLFCILTVRQNYLWANPIRFYEYTLRHTTSARLYSNLGMAYGDQRQFSKAIENYEKALSIAQYPQTYHNLANAYRDSGQPDLAIENYQKALAMQPDFYFSYSSLIELLIQKQRFAEATTLLTEIKTLWPDDPSILLFEVAVYAAEGKLDLAESSYAQLKQRFPTEPQFTLYAEQLLRQAQQKDTHTKE